MQPPSRLQTITSRLSRHTIRTSFRRSSSTSSTSSQASSSSQESSPVSSTINSIVLRQKTLGMPEHHDAEERPPHILEPRPAATFCSLEERMMAF